MRWTIPAVLVALWLVVGGIGGPLQGQLSEVQKNDNASFLPASAEATEVAELQKRFADKESLPALVLFERDTPLTLDDLVIIGNRTEELRGNDFVAGQVFGRQSADKKAVQVLVPVKPAGSKTTEQIAEIRDQVHRDLPAGVRAYVTGPAGLLGDFAKAFDGIDGLLLGVTAIVVAVILVIVYRSPILPLVVLVNAGLALCAAVLVVYGLAKSEVLTLNGQSQGILFILVFGASTDYSLLLVARFREELHAEETRLPALRTAWKQSFEPIVASAGTVILGLMCLLLSDLKSNQGLGPVAAIGVTASVLATLRRSAFWPFRPTTGTDPHSPRSLWTRVAAFVGRRPRWTWLVTAVVLLAGVAFVPQFKADGVPQTELFLTPVESVTGQDALNRHFPGGTGSPVVIIGPEGSDVESKVRAFDGVDDVQRNPRVVDGLVELRATLKHQADSPEAVATVRQLRADLDAKVGGSTAVQVDVRDTASRDLRTIIPIVLVVIFLVLALLLRALLAPVLLIATVVLSFAATLGVAALVFNHVLDFPGADPSVPLFAFVFLVALGIDYNIFLMTRVREESLRHGTRTGTLRGLTVTGGVITSAGVVLAATFAALAVLPLLFLAQIAFLVAFGVLLDTLLVRSLLVPALTVDIGGRVWWPARFPADGKSAGEVRTG